MSSSGINTPRDKNAIEQAARWIREQVSEPASDSYDSIIIDDQVYDALHDALRESNNQPGNLLKVYPPKENGAISAGVDFWQTMHDPRKQRVFGAFISNVSPWHSFEMWYDGGEVGFYCRPPNEPLTDKVRSQLRNNYPDVEVETLRDFDDQFPKFEKGWYASAAKIRPQKAFWYPISSPLTEQRDEATVGEQSDPYGDMTTNMVVENSHLNDGTRVSKDDASIILQVMIQSARDCWTDDCIWGKDMREVANALRQSEYRVSNVPGEDVYEVEAGRKERMAARTIRKQENIKGYYVGMRVIAMSKYEEVAVRRAREVAADCEDFFESFTRQRLRPISLPAEVIPQTLVDTGWRRHEISTRDRIARTNPEKFILTAHGVGAIAHLPNEEINEPAVNWSTVETGSGAPVDTTEVEDAMARDPAQEQRRRATFDADEYEQEVPTSHLEIETEDSLRDRIQRRIQRFLD